MVKFRCERCNALMKCPDDDVGQPVVCPTCQHKQRVPKKAPPKHNKLLLVGGAAAALVLIVWAAWAVLGPEEKPPAPEPAEAGAADTKGAPTASRGPEDKQDRGTKKEGRREAAEKAWEKQKQLYEERRLSEGRRRQWEALDAMERDAKRVEKEMQEEERKQERARREFERKQRLKELEEQRKKQLNP